MKHDRSNRSEEEKHSEYTLNIWLPAGIGLLGIGLLTLATPLFTTLNSQGLLIDIVAGGVLTIIGVVGILKGWNA